MTSENGKRTGILATLTEQELAAMQEFVKARKFEKGECILANGQYNDSLFLVTSGLLHARMPVDDGHTLLSRLEPDSFFGEISVFDPGKTTAAVVAVTRGELWEMRRDELLDFVDRHPKSGAKLMLSLMQEIARRVRASDDRLGDALLLNRLLGD